MEDWAEIRRLHRAEGLPIKAIGRRLGVSRNAVRRALASEEPPRYSRPARGSAVDSFEPGSKPDGLPVRVWPTTWKVPAITVIGIPTWWTVRSRRRKHGRREFSWSPAQQQDLRPRLTGPAASRSSRCVATPGRRVGKGLRPYPGLAGAGVSRSAIRREVGTRCSGGRRPVRVPGSRRSGTGARMRRSRRRGWLAVAPRR